MSIRNLIFRSVWARVFIPLFLAGANAVSVNLMAWECTINGRIDLNVLVLSKPALAFLISGVLLYAYEQRKAKNEGAGTQYIQNVLEQTKPDMVKFVRQQIRDNKFDTAVQQLNVAKSLLDTPNQR